MCFLSPHAHIYWEGKGRRQTSSVGSQATPDCTEKGQAVATNLKNCTLGTDFFL